MTIETRLAEIRARVGAATEGPWAPWYDQDGAPHMGGLLMVGDGDGVIPEGETWIEGVDINPVAHTYTPEDREFIAASRTDLPALLAAVEAVMALHKCLIFPDDGIGEPTACGHCDNETWPCRTIRAITDALDADTTREDQS